MSAENMIELAHLSKRYGKFLAVDDVNLAVAKGEIFGFLGPNGAGKTTTIKIMAGLIRPTLGNARIGGFDIARQGRDAKAVTGFIPDRPYIYGKLTGAEFLRFIAGIYAMPRAASEKRLDEMLELFELADWRDELTEGYSHGMKQRLVMSAALLHSPRVLIVDEPMVGLDPKGARLVKQIFRRMRDLGVCIFMSTHSMGVAEEMCDRIGIIQEGRMIAVGGAAELRAQSGELAGRLEEVFMKLTGEQEAGMSEIVQALNF